MQLAGNRKSSLVSPAKTRDGVSREPKYSQELSIGVGIAPPRRKEWGQNNRC